MGLSLSRIYGSLSSLAFWGKDKEVRILMVGLDSAGKTTILYRLQVSWYFLLFVRKLMEDRRSSLNHPECVDSVLLAIRHDRDPRGVVLTLAIGFNVETVSYKNINFQVWDLGGQSSIRPYWRCYYANTQVRVTSKVASGILTPDRDV